MKPKKLAHGLYNASANTSSAYPLRCVPATQQTLTMNNASRSNAKLRVLEELNAEAYRDIRLRALLSAPESFGESYLECSARPLEFFSQRLVSHPDGFTIGAFRDETLIGTTGFYRESALKMRHKGVIVGMYVQPSERGQGVGRQLLDAVVTRASALAEIEQLQISVVTSNRIAKALYESAGFEDFGREPHALKVEERYHDECHPVRILSRTPVHS